MSSLDRQSSPSPVAEPPATGPRIAPAASQPRGNAFAQAQVAAPSQGGLERASNPQPVVPGEQRRVVLGVEILGRDVSPSALDACERFVTATLGQRRDIQERMREERVVLVILPRDKKMTDLAEFASLRGTRTFDGRLWDDVRGSGGMRIAGGRWAIGVPEENLVTTSPDNDRYGTGYSVGLHEFAHTIHSHGVTGAERRRIDELYAARSRAGGPWTEAYGASNAQEYYAQCTNCFFGMNRGVGQNGAEWLQRNDPAMYEFLVTIYGQPPRPAASRA